MSHPTDLPPSNDTGSRARRYVALAALGLVTVAAGYLRSRQLGESLWIDELHTAWAADGSLAEVAPRAWIGNQSPLYFYLVWGLTRLFGMSEFIVRLPSLVAGILLVPASYYVVVRWTKSRAAGLLSAILIGIDPGCLNYALEARPYALVQLAAVVHVYVFSQLVLAERVKNDANESPSPPRSLIGQRTAWVLVGALLFHLHYTAALLLPAELAAYALIWPWRRRRMIYGPRRLVVDLLLIAVSWAPAGPHLLEVAARRDNWKEFIPQASITDTVLWYPLVYAIVWPMIVLAIAVSVRCLFGSRPIIGRVSIPLFLLVAAWETVPAAIAWIATQADVARLFFPRYLNVSVPAAAAIAGLISGWTQGRFARLLQLVVVGSGAVFVYAVNIGPIYQESGRFTVHSQEDWRGAVTYINRQNTEESAHPLLVYSNLIEARQLTADDPRLAAYCLFPVTGIYKLRGDESSLIALPADGRVQLTHQQTTHLRSSGGVWLVVRNPPGRAALVLNLTIAEIVHAGIPRNRIDVRGRRFGDVAVYRIDYPTE